MYKYKRIRLGQNNFIDYHRQIVENFLERKLSSNEIVHHKDGNINNNNITNLQLMTKSEHMKLHRKDGTIHTDCRKLRKKSIGGKYKCTICKLLKFPNEYYLDNSRWNKLSHNCKECDKEKTKKYRNTPVV